MCGFAGVFNFISNEDADIRLVERMAQKIAHRGPDEEGAFSHDSFAVCHRRLAIIDISTGRQPLTDENGTLWLVFNGTIYNYQELRSELISRGHHFRTGTDTEVILHLFEEEGPSSVLRLNGMFAFALYDKKNKKLFMARDRFGIKPLYYSITKSGIVFASEIKAILEYPGIEGSPCYEAIGEYVKFQFVLGDRTFFKEVKKLEPAMTLECQASSPGSKDSGFLKLHRYWAPELEIDRGMTPEKVSTKLLLLLEDSVRLRMRSDVPVGVTLSGGLDSSILTLLASTLVDRPLETFTGYFDVSEKYDEREYSGGVADEARAIKNEILIDARDFVRALDHMAYILDEPVAGPGSIPQFLVNKKAREKVKVLLGGQGGDELFGGYARYLLLYLERAILAASGDTRLDEGISLESLSPGLGALSDYRPLMKSFFSDGVFGDIEERYLSLIDRSRGKLDIYTDEFLEQVKLEEAFLKAREIFRSINTESLFNRMTYFDFMTLLPALLTVDDRAGMAVSLETRAPYLDHRIVELVFRVPAKIKFSGGELKSLLREAAKQILPEKIRMRKDKKGFPVPVSEWLKEGPLLEFARERLLDGIAVNRGIFEPQKLEEHLSRENPYGRAVWGALSIELWFEKFIDR